ncbi:glycosyltransferase family 4 protein [Clostridium disporicum]|uniref:Glycosyltransferase n=1 Tax=Clostridium disporicum TaxID=84024 RepID=A0A174EZI5_9CLOT|nr:glycosyltransferase family 1 protein [Clostridium disporicum]CUO42697.1 glycosyltransferase [Clostridium disporicum]
MQNLYINGTMLDERPTGLGVYIKNIVLELKKKNIKFKLFCPIEIEGVEVIKTTEKVKTSYKKKGGLYRFLWTQFLMPFKVNKNDIVYHPFQYLSLLTRAKQIITIHDFIPLYYPNVAKHQYYYYKFIMPLLLKKADKIICISENTKNDIIKFYNIDNNKIIRIYNGYDEELFNTKNIDENILEKYNLDKEYFISVGAGYSHKNIETALLAFKNILKDNNCDYVIVGKESEYIKKLKEKVEELGIHNNVKFVGYVADKDLPTLYNKAIAFIYPTLYEGFGLPILEAMACETLVLTSDNSSLPEVYGKSAIDFNALDVEGIEKAMRISINRRDIREEYIVLSKKQLEKFNWEKTAGDIIKVFNELKK